MEIPAPKAGWPTVTLAIDPGAVSGAALFVRNQLQQSWIVKDCETRRICLVEWRRMAVDNEDLRSIIVYEDWTFGPRSKDKRATPATIKGMGASQGRWLEQMQIAGVPPSQIHRVNSRTWQAWVKKLDKKKKLEKQDTADFVRSRCYGVDIPDNQSSDAYDACAIGLWAAQSDDIGEKIPKRYLKRYL